jgi:hypothetical protein
VQAKCEACHTVNAYKTKTDADCVACHRKDDKHEGDQGVKCGDCHDEREWKIPRYNHARTRFPLLGKHVRVECAKCHKTQAYRKVARDCYGCHEADDKHKLTLGRDCTSCHNARDWKLWDFDHAKRAKYPLDGKHAKVTCAQCHTLPGDPVPALARECVACHRKDDVHNGDFGPVCERCHVTRSWKDIVGPGAKRAALTLH